MTPAVDNSQTLLSIILPAHNEAASLHSVVEHIRKTVLETGVRYEIIVVDDGSSDNTFGEIERLCVSDRHVRGIRFSRNFGKESALLAGLVNAKGAAVITMDADHQHPPELIPQMLQQWHSGFKVVHGVKTGRQVDSWFARTSADLFNSTLTMTTGLDMHNASDYKLLDRAAVDVIVQQLPERGRFFRALAGWVGFEQTTVPFDVVERESGSGNWSGFALIDLAVTAITSFTSAPLRIITVLGVITLVFGMVVSIEALWSWFAGKSVSGFVTIIITLLLIGSSIMISLGIIGEYIAKIYEEVKNRPAYVVKKKCGFDKPESNET